jgi:hypothetical protein
LKAIGIRFNGFERCIVIIRGCEFKELARVGNGLRKSCECNDDVFDTLFFAA